jgi:type IV pilus assembly protein PilM
MSDSIWKKEISFRRKPAAPASAEPAAEKTSIWKKEISFGRRREAAAPAPAPLPYALPEHPTIQYVPVPVPVYVQAQPVGTVPPVVSMPFAAPSVPVADIVPPPMTQPVSIPVEPQPVVQPVSFEPAAATESFDVPPVTAEPIAHDPAPVAPPVTAQPAAYEPAPVSPSVPTEPQPVVPPVAEYQPAPVLPPLPRPARVSAWPTAAPVLPPAAPVAYEPAPVVPPVAPASIDVAPPVDEIPAAAGEPAPAADEAETVEIEPKVPFWKKELSLKRKPKAPKAEAEAKTPFWKKELSLKRKPKAEATLEVAAEPKKKTPFWKQELSLKRKPKAEKAPKQKRAKRDRKSKGSKSQKKLVGLKIGASQIAAARVTNNGAAELLQVARDPLASGVVVNGEVRDADALAEALKEFFKRHKLPRRNVRLGIASNRIGVRTFDVAGVADDKQLANAVQFRAQETLPIPLEDAVLDYQVLGEAVNEEGEPVKRVLLVVAYREVVDRYVAACRKAGVSLVGVDLEAFALLRALGAPVQENEANEAALVAVAIGHDRSTLAVSDGRVCEFTRVLEWGGGALNVALARALDLAPSEAESYKRALSLETGETPDDLSPEQGATALEAVRKQIQNFARELVSSLQFYQNQPGSLGIGEIVLTGGTAHLPGLAAELQRLIGVSVRVGDPLARVKVRKKVGEPGQSGSLAVAIGLGIED